MHLPEFQYRRGKREKEMDQGGRQRSVTMAPAATSRYRNNRQYAMRKPLFCVEQQASILKKTPEDHPEEENHVSVSRTDDQWNTNMKQLTLESFRFPPRELPPPSASRGELRSPPPSSHISDRLAREETTVGPPLPGSRAAQQSHSSSTLEVQRLTPPLRPRLTSTVLYPTYTPLPASSIRGQTELRLRRRATKQSKDMSSYQSNYWACAIPKSVPPSPDRQAASWDPNREYRALLDYTYPLRPGQGLDGWGSSELLQSDLTLQDSGIDLDNFCSSTKLSGLDFCPSSSRQTSERINSCEHQHQLDPTLADESSDSDCGLDTGDPNHCKGGGQHHHHHHHHHHRGLTSFIPNAFIRSTSVLPQSRGEGGEIDKEFWRLPDKLEELQFLSRQVREVKAQLSRPVTASSESLETGSASIRSFTTLPEKREDHQETDEEEADAAETAHGGTWKAAGRSHPAWVGSAGGGLVLDDTQRSNQEAPEQSSSLMQHIQRFQRAVSSQQVRTSRVLHAGQQLLSCINNTSPVLTDTLLLLERQLRVLESHTDLLFPSILSAIDGLTPPSPAE